MRLNRGTLILLLGSIIIIAVVLIFQEPFQNIITPETPTPGVQTLLPNNLVDRTTQLIVRRRDDFSQVDKVDDLWVVTEGTALDESRETHHDFVEGLLELMATFEYTSRFETQDLAQFGLEPAIVEIEIVTIDEPYRLTLGETNPDGNSVYVQLNGTNEVYLVPAVFELGNIVKLATEPPYRQLLPEVTEDPNGNVLFPDIFGYQVAIFLVQDERDGSFIRYTQGEFGTWVVDGTVVNEEREINHVQAAINVSQFLFLDVKQLNQQVSNTVSAPAILTISIKTDDNQSRTMSVISVDEVGFVGILDDELYILPSETVQLFIDMVRQPPYV